jgi:hypothetical protein
LLCGNSSLVGNSLAISFEVYRTVHCNIFL